MAAVTLPTVGLKEGGLEGGQWVVATPAVERGVGGDGGAADRGLKGGWWVTAVATTAWTS